MTTKDNSTPIYRERPAEKLADSLATPGISGINTSIPQPLLDSGDVILSRGVHESDVFRFLQVDRHNLDQEKLDVWQKYIKTQGQVLSDSILSFNTIHDRTKRCETSHRLDGTWIGDKIARANGPTLRRPGWRLGEGSAILPVGL